MITFIVCLVLLIAAYFLYGKVLEKIVGINPKTKVPSETRYDGIDYMPIPKWKSFLIQLLNIAGIGPIFGAIMGACFGPIAFLWITIGGIFMGAMCDFLSGVIIVRNDGLSLSEIIGRYQGKTMKSVFLIVLPILLVMVGVVFISSPANILNELLPSVNTWWWIGIIFIYYFIATFLPINKIITKIYPVFGFALIFMALSLLCVLITQNYVIPELNFVNYHAKSLPIIPTLFITIACGAISGFHATQSPLMARCINNESECRFVFYGSMISESIIALIWAAIAMAFFSGPDGLNEAMSVPGHDAPWVVSTISTTTLGIVGGILAVLGVVIAPITTGDTSFRSARLTIADAFHINQNKPVNRLLISLPLFAIAVVLLFVDFDIIWRYFSWSNQLIACITLWCIVNYLYKNKRNYWVAVIPALFMTYICSSFVMISNQFIGLGAVSLSYIIAGIFTIVVAFIEYRLCRNSVPKA